jgi:hypothetical protein
MDQFTEGYIECAYWSSITDEGKPMDSMDNEPAAETTARMIADCAKFQADNAGLLELACQYQSLARQGHDFWLTRNHHGAGFWDGDYPKELGEALTKASRAFSECDLYIGDDGLIYLFP